MNKNSTQTIRMATQIDAKTIAKIHLRSWQKMYKDFIPSSILKNFSMEERTQQWEDLINQGVKVLLIETDDKIVGFASICTFRDAHLDSTAGEISAIYLEPAYWRQGLGKKLSLAAVAELEKLGFKKVQLWVLEDNSLARGFYEALNFEITDSTKLEEFYEGGALLTHVLYKKTIG